MPRELSTSEAAAALQISPATLQKYAREGRVPFDTTPGGHRRFDLAEIRRALDLCAPQQPDSFPRRAVILTALPTEYDSIRRRLANATPRRLDSGTRYEMGEVAGSTFIWEVAVAEIGPGNEAAAIEATRAIDILKPDLLLFVGVAGSLKPDDAPTGSVVVATRIYGYEYGKADKQFLPRPISFPTAHALEQVARTVIRERWANQPERPPAIVAAIAAGNSVVSSKDSALFTRIRTVYNDAVAIEMESLGMYMAAHRSRGLSVLSVRGISDCVFDKNPEGDASTQPTAADNAAELAFAILAGINPGDLGPRVPETIDPLAALRTEALIPASVQEELDRLDTNGLLKWHLQRHLSSPEVEPHALALELLETSPPWMEGEAWAVVAEYCSAYEMLPEATIAFERAAQAGDRPGRNLARAAVCQAALRLGARANELLSLALEEGSSEVNLAVIGAVLAEDAAAIIAETEGLSNDHRLELIYRARALAASSREDEALTLAERILEAHPGTTSASVMVAQLLIWRASTGGSPGGTERDLLRARSIALSARDLRRQWRGDSSEAARVAVEASMALTDFQWALRLSLPEPEGEALADEAGDSAIQRLATRAALAVGDMACARRVIDRVDGSALRALLSAELLLAEDRPAEAEPLYREVLANGSDDQHGLALYGLARAGMLRDEDIAAAGTLPPGGLSLVRVEALVASGKLGEAATAARECGEPAALASVADAYSEANRPERAVELFDAAADISYDAEFRAMAASVLRRNGQLEEALGKAETALSGTAPGTTRHRRIRRLCISIASEGDLWAKAIEHSRAALTDGDTHVDIRWTLAFSLANTETYAEALSVTLEDPQLEPRSGNEALLVISLEAQAGRGAASANRVLEIAENFIEDERVANSAFTALLMLTSELEFDEDIAGRLAGVSENYFSRYGDAGAVRRFSSTPEDFPAALEAVLAPSSGEREALLSDVLQKIRMDQYPLVMLAVSLGRSYAEALVKRAAGYQPAAMPSPDREDEELRAARDALGGPVVIESSAIEVMMSAGLHPRRVLARFSKTIASAAGRRDAITALTGLRLKGKSFLGWDSAAGRPTLTEVKDEVAEEWFSKARVLAGVFEKANCVAVYAGGDRPDAALAALHPFEIAKARGVPLYSDDVVLRSMAASEGVATFGTLGLMKALLADGSITEQDYLAGTTNMRWDCIVDFSWNPETLHQLGEASGWQVSPAIAAALSRPAFWADFASAWDNLRPSIVAAAAEGHLAEWVASAVFGLRTAGAPSRAVGAFMAVVCNALGSETRPLADALDGARRGGAEDALPVFCAVYLDALRSHLDEEMVAKVFMSLIEHLEPDDRAEAMQIMLRPAAV